jgi:hypothetical protein
MTVPTAAASVTEDIRPARTPGYVCLNTTRRHQPDRARSGHNRSRDHGCGYAQLRMTAIRSIAVIRSAVVDALEFVPCSSDRQVARGLRNAWLSSSAGWMTRTAPRRPQREPGSAPSEPLLCLRKRASRRRRPARCSPCSNPAVTAAPRQTTASGCIQQPPLTRSAQPRLLVWNERERVAALIAGVGESGGFVPTRERRFPSSGRSDSRADGAVSGG